MGNNNSMINVSFDRPQPTIYYAGDTISGQINLKIPTGADNIHDIYLVINGDVGYTTVRTTRMQNGQTERITDHHDVRIFEQKLSISQALCPQQSQAICKLTNRKIVEPGQYTYPFSVRLPDTLPPTLHPTDYPFVRYELQLFIEKKWYNQDAEYRYPLRIYPRVNLLEISNSQCAVKFDTKRNDIKIHGLIQSAGLSPGEQTNMFLEVNNPNHLTIKRIDVCLIQRYEIELCRRRLELTRISVPELMNKNNAHIEITCPIIIPNGIAPTCKFKGKYGDRSVHISLHYDIRLEIKVKGLFTDFDLQVPIIIGTDPSKQSNSGDKQRVPTASIDLNTIDILELQAHDDTST